MSATAARALPRSISHVAQLKTLLLAQLKLMLRQRKTIALLIVQLIPALAALFYVVFGEVDGLTLFGRVLEYVSFPFLVPLTALFYGGPTIVDEMEGRTLTYLTLRPIARPVIFLGKLLAGCILGALLVALPTFVLFVVCLASSEDLGASALSMLQSIGAATFGVICYTAIFAALGALFARSLISGIIYFVIFEMVLAVLPVLELLSVRYYLRTLAEFNAGARLGMLDQFVLDKPIVFPIWGAALILLGVTIAASAAGALIFKEKQYVV